MVISDSTRKLVGGLFEFADLGPRDLKGLAGPARAWRRCVRTPWRADLRRSTGPA
jgi:class 3 adenylate cyclase